MFPTIIYHTIAHNILSNGQGIDKSAEIVCVFAIQGCIFFRVTPPCGDKFGENLKNGTSKSKFLFILYVTFNPKTRKLFPKK